jgi:DeoR family deoxyribose operon repressor
MGKKEIRLTNVMQLLKENGTMLVSDMSEHLDVSLMTIRRDLDELRSNGLVVRGFGKASLAKNISASYENIENTYTLDDEKGKMIDEKRRIGKLAAELIEPGDVIILDNGSTTDQMVEHLQNIGDLTVACSNLNIARKLCGLANIKLLLAGGYYHPTDFIFESAQGVQFLQEIRATKAFISASGVHDKLGLTCAHAYEAAIKQTMIHSSLKKILLVDSTKFGMIKTSLFAQLGDISTIITDTGINKQWKDILFPMGIELKLA